jgi:hypothetical protein
VEVEEVLIVAGGGGAGGYRESCGTASGCYTASPLANACGALPVSAQGYPITVAGGAGTTTRSFYRGEMVLIQFFQQLHQQVEAGGGSATSTVWSSIRQVITGGSGGGACGCNSRLMIQQGWNRKYTSCQSLLKVIMVEMDRRW